MIKLFLDYSFTFLTMLFPASFIFFILSSLIIDFGGINLLYVVFRDYSAYFYVLLISMISGFPSGYKTSVELFNKKLIDYNNLKRSIMYCHFPNPLFVLGSVSNIIGISNSIYILLSIFISNFIIFLFVLSPVPNSYSNSNNIDFNSSLVNSIKSSFIIMEIVYGISIFFYLISIIILGFINNSYLYVLISGIFDLTKGIFSTSILSSETISSYFILFFFSFSGISIHMQIKSILKDTSLYKSFLLGRFISTILSLLIFSCFIMFGNN